jgi:hypothetical protein
MKNSTKGFGYLFGSLLLFYAGWVAALCIQGALLLPIFVLGLKWMENDLGISEIKRKKGIPWCVSPVSLCALLPLYLTLVY